MKKTFSLLLLSLCTAAVVLTGCSKSAKASGDELVISNGTEPQSLDPSKIQGVPEHRIYMSLFEGLVRYDPKTSEAVPGVAESWTRSEDGTVLTFKLRSDAQWSDGTKITARTFVDSWLYYMAPETAAEYAYMPAMVIKGAADYNAGKADKEKVGIRAVDERTFEVTLVGPLAYAVNMMAHYSFAPLPLHAIKKFGAEWTRPANFVGDGPFVLEDWVPQEKITVVPNKKYWNKKNVFLSRITFLPIENQTTAYQKYKNNESDWVTSDSIPYEMLDEISLRDDFLVSPMLSTYYYIINMNNPVLKDVRVRKALSLSLDRKELVEKVLKGGQIPVNAFVPPMPGYSPQGGEIFNLDEAKKLFADAGYPDGKGFPVMTVIYNTNENHKKIAEWVQQTWKKNLGIDIKLENMEWATFLDQRQSNNFEIARAGWVGDFQDPSNFLELFLKKSGNNDGRYDNPDYDALLKNAASLPDGEERNKALMDAESILIKQDQGIVPFYYYVSQNLINLNNWEGWYDNTLDIHPYVGLKRK